MLGLFLGWRLPKLDAGDVLVSEKSKGSTGDHGSDDTQEHQGNIDVSGMARDG